MIYTTELRMATRRLPGDLRTWMCKALSSGDYDIAPFSYEDGPGRNCPVGAAADLAGAWIDGGIHDRPAWGTSDEPEDAVEDFAAYFDLSCEVIGLDLTLEIVESELALGLISRADNELCEPIDAEAA